MRIVQVIADMGTGGAQAVVGALVQDSLGRGDAVTIASSGGWHAERLNQHGAELCPLRLEGRHPADLARSVGALRKAVRRSRPDLVHVHNVKAALVTRVAVGHRAPIIASLHGVPERQYPVAARVLRRSADRVVAVSDHVAERLLAHGYPGSRLQVIENSIVPLDRRPRAEARARLGLTHDVPTVLCLARLAEQKRHDLLLRAWESVGDGAMLLLAGDGPTRGSVEALVADHPHRERIRLLGTRTDPDWLLAAADAMVLPTDWEGLPISVLEALDLGVPVVVSRVGGVVDTLGTAVELVEPGSAGALAAGLAAVLRDPAHRAELAARGKQLVRTTYAPERMLEAYCATYAVAARETRERSAR